MENICETIPIKISRNIDVVENVYFGINCSLEVQIYIELFKEFRDVFSWSYEEMPDIDLSIVEYEIKTYPNAKPVHQKLRLVNHRKVVVIKAKVEKLLREGFIYMVPLT